MSTANSKALVGKSTLVRSVPFEATFGAFVTVLRPGPRIDPEYLAFWMRTSEYAGKMNELASQTTNIANLNVRDLLDMQLPLVDLLDQRRVGAEVAARLDAVEALRRSNSAKSRANTGLRAVTLEGMLGGEAAGQWDRPYLATLLRSSLRTGVSGPESEDGVVMGLSLASVRNGRLDLTKTKRVAVDPATNRTVREGCFYMVRGNGRLSLVGRAGLAPHSVTPLVFPDLLIEADLDPIRVNSHFFRLVWDSREVREDIESRARTAAGIHKINLANLAAVRVPMPSVHEQQRIARELGDRLAVIDTMSKAIEAEREAIEALPAALLRRAFENLAA